MSRPAADGPATVPADGAPGGLAVFVSFFAKPGIVISIFFLLVYRLPAEGWQQGEDVPLQDAQRAMRVIRAALAKLMGTAATSRANGSAEHRNPR